MSKLLILVLILMGIIFIPSLLSDRSSLMFRPNITSVAFGDSIRVKENQKWEYVKSRLFPKGGNVAPKFNGPILISLENATDKQRILVGDIAKEIGELIPNKAISLYKDHTGFTSQEIIDSVSNSSVLNDLFDLYTESISVTFGEKPSPNTDYIRGSRIVFPRLERSVLSDSTVIQRNRNSLIPIKEIAGSILCFNFSNRSDSIKQRNYIKYELLRSLCTVAEDNGFDFNIQNPIQRLNRFQYIMNKNDGVYSTSEYHPENYIISEYDKFLLKKLYSDDFQSQLKGYLSDNYPTLYVYNFYHSARMKIFSEILVLLLGVIIFIMSLSILHKRRFRFGFIGYLIPILLINISILGLSNLMRFLQLDYTLSIYYRQFLMGFTLRVIIISVVQALIIWVLEYFLKKKFDNFVLTLVLKMAITFSSFLLPYYFISWYTYRFEHSILIINLTITISRGLYIYLNHYSESITRRKDVEISQLKELQLATELNSLHAQINPHFLYNALNSIASLSKIDGTKTEKMALSLSDLFRYSVNRKGEKMATIQEEVEMFRTIYK
ncbi:MAG: histidine kinase [Flavobacteriaceae bacterium]|nr:histidine kinase [Flavobacteriaceae bacterium]